MDKEKNDSTVSPSDSNIYESIQIGQNDHEYANVVRPHFEQPVKHLWKNFISKHIAYIIGFVVILIVSVTVSSGISYAIAVSGRCL